MVEAKSFVPPQVFIIVVKAKAWGPPQVFVIVVEAKAWGPPLDFVIVVEANAWTLDESLLLWYYCGRGLGLGPTTSLCYCGRG